MIIDLGQHDVIIGWHWLSDQDVWLDVQNRRLIWPNEQTLEEELKVDLMTPIPRQILKQPAPNPDHQADMERRDQHFNKSDKKDRYQDPRQEETVQYINMAKIECTLADDRKSRAIATNTSTDQKIHHPIDIALIGAAPFHRHIRRKDTEVFTASLHEIDRIIEEKRDAERQEEDLEEQQAIQEKLPEQYCEYTDVFSKSASDEMPPHRLNDYRIHLEEGHSPEQSIGYSPLYKQSIEELKATCDYIIDNLFKGFIGPSTAPFASPILMARKPGGGL